MVVMALLFITPMTRIKLNHMNLLKSLVIFLFSFLVVYAGTEEENELALHHFMQGEFLMNQGNYAMAVLEFQEAIELDPNAATIHVSIADAYRRLGKFKRAENHLHIAIELDPDEKDARQMLGQLYISNKRYQEAEMKFLELNRLDPYNSEYLVILGDLAKLQYKWNDAINHYLSAFDINPNVIEPDVYFDQTHLIELGSQTIELSYFGPSHGECLIAVQIQPANLLFIADLLNIKGPSFPNDPTLPYLRPATLISVLSAMEKLAEANEINSFIAGQSSAKILGSIETISKQREFWQLVQSTAEEAEKNGNVDLNNFIAMDKIDLEPFQKFQNYNQEDLSNILRRYTSFLNMGR